jgi:crotonobetainyl-CoA:carnitine CoA-transferase CaiB-like acyl-CoA transferase
MTIIAVEQYGAGPFGSMLLADLGADVIKIENPAEKGEISRHVGPYFFDGGSSHFFQSFNRNKRSVTLNLKHPEGRAILRKLAANADAVYNNLRGDQPEKLGLNYEALKDVNPRLVCAHLSAYGRTGPRKAWPGYDYLMQAESGYLSVTGEPESPPSRMGLSIVDLMTGLMAAFGLVSCVMGARTSGKGMDVDTCLFDTAIHNLAYLATWYLNANHTQGREPRSSHPNMTPSQLYKTQDGWIFIMCNKEKFWPILAEKVGKPEWGTDPRFANFEVRLENRALLTQLLDEAFSVKTTVEWMDILGGTVPCAPVFDVAQALTNPFAVESGRVAAYTGGDVGNENISMLASPLTVGGVDLPTRAAPALGADTEDVLKSIGIAAADIAGLKQKGVL